MTEWWTPASDKARAPKHPGLCLFSLAHRTPLGEEVFGFVQVAAPATPHDAPGVDTYKEVRTGVEGSERSAHLVESQTLAVRSPAQTRFTASRIAGHWLGIPFLEIWRERLREARMVSTLQPSGPLNLPIPNRNSRGRLDAKSGACVTSVSRVPRNVGNRMGTALRISARHSASRMTAGSGEVSC
jgi:hypothetical protein